jgi:cell division protein FtsL
MGFALIAQFTRVAQVGLEISTLRGTQAELEMQQKDLQLRIAEAQSNRRIQKYINESGMVPALKVDVVYLSIQPTATDIPVEVIP